MAIFFLNACQNEPQIIEKLVYVDKPVPKLTILPKVAYYQIEDYRSFDETYWLINKVEFDKASDRIKQKEHKIIFYEKQNIQFNNKFATQIQK